MGYAPQSSIETGPTPAASGTVLTVPDDNGDRFPDAPFTYLAWPTQTIPRLGVDSEEGVCLSVNHDTFTLQRPANAVAISAGMQFAAKETIDVYSIEELITLSETFPITDTNVALQLRTPGGAVGRYVAAGTAAALSQAPASGGSAYSLAFEANESGLWGFEFTSDQRTKAEDEFFVRFTEVY